MNIIKKLKTIKHRGSVYELTTKNKVLLFIGLIIGQQIPPFVYKVFYYANLNFLGLVFGLISAFLIVKIPLSFSEYNEKMNITFKKKVGLILGTIGCIILLAITIQPLFAKIFNLNVTNMVSPNQQNINVYFTDIYSILFILPFTLYVGPLIEELLFRATIINPKDEKNRIKQQIQSMIGFSLLHTAQSLIFVANGQLNIMAWLYTNIIYLIFGFAFTTIYIKYDNLRITLMCHIAWNVFATILILYPIISNII